MTDTLVGMDPQIDPGPDTLIVWPSERSSALYQRCGFNQPAELLERPIAPN